MNAENNKYIKAAVMNVLKHNGVKVKRILCKYIQVKVISKTTLTSTTYF